MERDEQLRWRRASRCESSACVEVSRVDDSVLVRDGADPDGPVIAVTVREWAAFVAWLKRGAGGATSAS